MATYRKNTPLEQVLGSLDELDSRSLNTIALRLARERRFFEAVVDAVRDGILVIDAEGLIIYANASSMRFLGFEERNVGRDLLWKFAPELARSMDFKVGEGLRRDTTATREVAVTYPEHRIVRFYFEPLERLDGKREREEADFPDRQFLVVLSDVTEDRMSTAEQIENERVNSIILLAAGVAHELGNPLNSLNIHLQLISRQLAKLSEGPARERIEQSVGVSSRELERLDHIIRHFLEAIRPQKPDLQDVDLGLMLTEVLELLEPEMTAAEIAVDIVFPSEIPVVLADRNMVKQVYFNVLRNARDAMKRGGSVRIRMRTDDEYVIVQVGDTGEGMSPEAVQRVFQPYFTTKPTGHGLGMMIAQRIMRDHGGRIGVDSEPGRGTVITLQFPKKNRRVRMLEA